MSTAQFKKKTTHLDIPGRVYDLYQHVVKTCPFCNLTKPRPDRSRVSGLRAEEFGELIFLDHGSTNIVDKTFGFLIVLNGATSHVRGHLHQKSFPNFVSGLDTFQMNPKAICADVAFHHPHDTQAFYRMHNVKILPTGPHTPWPNRAEIGARLFKKFLPALVDTASNNLDRTTLSQITPAQPILYSLPQMQYLGITLELAPKGAKITCPAFGLNSSPVEYTTHIVLDLTSVPYQPKSRERSARPRKHLTFALSQRKSAYPARVQKLDDDEDDKPSVQPTSVLKRESSAIRSDPTPLRRRKRPPVWRDSSATLEQDASGNSPERSEDISGLGKSDGEALQKFSQQVFGCSQLETPSSEALPHAHCTVQEENNPLGYSWKCV